MQVKNKGLGISNGLPPPAVPFQLLQPEKCSDSCLPTYCKEFNYIASKRVFKSKNRNKGYVNRKMFKIFAIQISPPIWWFLITYSLLLSLKSGTGSITNFLFFDIWFPDFIQSVVCFNSLQYSTDISYPHPHPLLATSVLLCFCGWIKTPSKKECWFDQVFVSRLLFV